MYQVLNSGLAEKELAGVLKVATRSNPVTVQLLTLAPDVLMGQASTLLRYWRTASRVPPLLSVPSLKTVSGEGSTPLRKAPSRLAGAAAVALTPAFCALRFHDHRCLLVDMLEDGPSAGVSGGAHPSH